MKSSNLFSVQDVKFYHDSYLVSISVSVSVKLHSNIPRKD